MCSNIKTVVLIATVVIAILAADSRVAVGDQGAEPNLANGPFQSVCFSADRNQLLTASIENGGELWDLATGKRLRQFKASGEYVYSAIFSPDEKSVLTVPAEAYDMGMPVKFFTARTWDIATGKEVQSFPRHPYSVNRAIFSPDGKRILTVADQTTLVWDAKSGKRLFELLGQSSKSISLGSPVFSADSGRVLGIAAPGVVLIRSSDSGKELCRIPHSENSEPVNSAQFSPDGEFVATASDDKTVRTWNAKTGEQIVAFAGHTGFVRQAKYAADGRRIFSCSDDSTVRVWDIKTANEILRMKNPGTVGDAEMSLDGKRIIAHWERAGEASPTFGATLWDGDSGREIRRFDLPCKRGPNHAVFNHDGKQLVVAGDDSVELYDTATGKLLRKY